MKVSIETITPELAREWLALNSHNRPIRRLAVETMARDITAGAWSENGETIKFNGADLIDGQHRLLAVIEADKPIKSVVIRDADEEAQLTTDRGSRRTLGNDLHLRGYKSANNLAAAITLLWQIDRSPQGSIMHARPTVREAVALAENTPALADSVRVADQVSRSTGLSIPVGAVLHMKTWDIDQEDAAYFWERLADGVDLESGHPILQLRKALADDRVKRFARMGRTRQWALATKAWNLYREGERVQSLIWRVGGSKPERLPVPR
jgi:hypothetical protein